MWVENSPVENQLLAEQVPARPLDVVAEVPTLGVFHDYAQHSLRGTMQEAFPETHDVWVGEVTQEGCFFSGLGYVHWGGFTTNHE